MQVNKLSVNNSLQNTFSNKNEDQGIEKACIIKMKKICAERFSDFFGVC
jgi:hypothetical protein